MFKRVLTAGVLLLASVQSAAADNPAARRLESLLGNLKSWQTGFEQIVEGGGAKSKKPVIGTFALQRPGKFNWETSSPYHQKLVADGKALWTYDLDLGQVTVQDLEQGLGASPAALLSSGEAQLTRDFEVALVAGGRPGEDVFELTPKGEGSLYSNLGLVFTGGKLSEMSVVNSLSQRTVVRFKDSRENISLDPALFRFTPPDDEGVDLIDSRKKR